VLLTIIAGWPFAGLVCGMLFGFCVRASREGHKRELLELMRSDDR
jgi:hypothetical protein